MTTGAPHRWRHLVLGDRGVDRGGLDPAQAHLGARLQRHRPWKAPAVAVEHRQRPEIRRVQAHVPDQDVADRVQIRAAVVRDHALGPPGGPGGVPERDRLPLVGGIEGIECGIALGQQLVVGQLAQALARHVEHRVRHVDHQRLAFALRERSLDHAGILGVGQQHLGFAVVQNVGDGIGLQAHVQRVDHGARHRDAEMGIDHRGHVRQHEGDRVAGCDAAPCQRRGEAAAARAQFGVIGAPGPVDHRRAVGEHVGGPLEEAERRERHVVRGVLIQPLLIRTARGMLGEPHGASLQSWSTPAAIKRVPLET